MQRYRDSGIQRFRDLRIKGFRELGIQGCRDLETQGFRQLGIWRFRDLEIWGFRGFKPKKNFSKSPKSPNLKIEGGGEEKSNKNQLKNFRKNHAHLRADVRACFLLILKHQIVWSMLVSPAEAVFIFDIHILLSFFSHRTYTLIKYQLNDIFSQVHFLQSFDHSFRGGRVCTIGLPHLHQLASLAEEKRRLNYSQFSVQLLENH